MFLLVAAYLSFLYARRDNVWYLIMWACLTVAIFTKYSALLALPLFMLLTLRRKKPFRATAGIMLPISVLLAWMFLLKQLTGNPLAFVAAQAYWEGGIVDPLSQAVWVLTGWFTTQPAVKMNSQPWEWLLRDYVFVFPTVGLWLYGMVKRRSMDLGVIGLPFALVALTFTGMPAISIPRLILPAIWGLPIVYAKDVKERFEFTIILVVIFVAVGLFWTLGHVSGSFIA